MIEEKTIDSAVDYLESREEEFELLVEDFGQAQPALLAYILSESTEVLTNYEKEYLLFLALTVWKSFDIDGLGKIIPEVDPTQIEEKEDIFWGWMGDSKEKDFNKKIDRFFDETEEEELYAFIEDALEMEENEWLTPQGREAIFVFMATLIEVLSDAGKKG
jgi:membrane-bound lytic murein transglycosylase MltF